MPPKKWCKEDMSDMLDFEYIGINDEAERLLRKRGIYYITGEITEGSLLEIQQDILLKHLDPSWNEDIQIIINSVGGYVPEGWAFIDLLDFIRMDIKTTGMGEVASLGASILAAGTIGKRSATSNTTIMVHGMWTDFMRGNRQQLVDQFKWINQEHERDVKFWQAKSRYKTPEEVQEYLLNNRDNYMTPQDALSHGIIDFIVDSGPTSSVPKPIEIQPIKISKPKKAKKPLPRKKK